jgi:CRISPR-associated protein Csm3
MAHKLESKIIIKGIVIAETGLMIGGSSSALEIGGTDKPIIRNPVDKKPYIPGSSLKGKMRSLLEISRGTVESDGSPTQNPEHEAAQLFGHIKNNKEREKKQKQQPSRLIVRDGMITEDSLKMLKDTELLYTEVKAENSINRITAEANPRFFERVPRSAEFDLNITLNVFQSEQEAKSLDLVYECLRLIEDDYLGGGGSRGNGQVKFKLTSVVRRSVDYYRQGDEHIQVQLSIPEDLR